MTPTQTKLDEAALEEFFVNYIVATRQEAFKSLYPRDWAKGIVKHGRELGYITPADSLRPAKPPPDDGPFEPTDRGDVQVIGAPYQGSGEAKAERWRCTCCGAVLSSELPDSSWRQKFGTAPYRLICWQHKCPKNHPQSGYFDAEVITEKGPHVQREGQAPEETAEGAAREADGAAGGARPETAPGRGRVSGENTGVGGPVNPDPTDEDGGACMMYEHGMALERVPTVRWHECEPETREFWRACYRFAHSRGVAKGRAEGAERAERAERVREARKKLAELCALTSRSDIHRIARSLEALLSEEGG